MQRSCYRCAVLGFVKSEDVAKLANAHGVSETLATSKVQELLDRLSAACEIEGTMPSSNAAPAAPAAAAAAASAAVATAVPQSAEGGNVAHKRSASDGLALQVDLTELEDCMCDASITPEQIEEFKRVMETKAKERKS